ncbi:MAG TPA: oligosaccharide flippase family protein [Candidatus Methylomirabilis sp.]
MSAVARTRGGFLYEVSLTFGARVVGLFVTILASVIAARVLGPSGKGALAVTGLITSLAVQFGDLGLHASTTYFAARQPSALRRIATLSLWAGLWMGVLLSGLVLAAARMFPGSLGEIPEGYMLIPVVVIPFSLLSLYFQNLLLGMQRIFAFNVVDLAGRGVGLLATILVLYVLHLGVWELLVAGLVISVGGSLVTIWIVFREAPLSSGIDCALARDMLRYGMKFYLACLCAFLVIRIDLLMVNYFNGVTEAGIYSVAVGFADLLYMLPIAIGTILFPRIARDQAGEGGLTLMACRFAVILMSAVCLAAALLARPMILLLYGSAFTDSVRPLLWLLPGVFVLSLETIVANDLAGRGYPAVLVVYWCVGLLLNIGLNLILIPRWGATGAAAASTVTYAVMSVLVFRRFLADSGAPWRLAFVLSGPDVRRLYDSARSLLVARQVS